jgi:hypothetical protein
MITLLASLLPAAAMASAASLKEWRFFETKTAVYAVRRVGAEGKPGYEAVYKEAVFNNPEECRPHSRTFKPVEAFTLGLGLDEAGRGIKVLVRDSGTLNIYRKCQPESGVAPSAEHKVCLKPAPAVCAAGEDVSAIECKLPDCRLMVGRPGGAPSPLTARDLSLPIVAYAKAAPEGRKTEPAPAAGGDIGKLSPAVEKSIADFHAAARRQGLDATGQFVILDAKGNVAGVAPTEAEARAAAQGQQVVQVPKYNSYQVPKKRPTAATPTPAKTPAAPTPDMSGPDYSAAPAVRSDAPVVPAELQRTIVSAQREVGLAQAEAAQAAVALKKAKRFPATDVDGFRALQAARERDAAASARLTQARAALTNARQQASRHEATAVP